MSKIISALLLFSAFTAAVFIVLFRLRTPSSEGRSTPVRAFIGAVALFVLFLGGDSFAADNHGPVLLQEDGSAGEDRAATRKAFVATLREVWKTLNPGQAGLFENEARKGESLGFIRGRVARLLSAAFREIAYHVDRTEGADGSAMMCYKMSEAGYHMKETSETALAQLRFLSDAFASGKIAPDTALKSLETLANRIEIIGDFDALPKDDTSMEKARKAQPSDSALAAAALAVELNSGFDLGFTAAQRLQRLKDSMHDAVANNIPGWSDWVNPEIRPSVASLMKGGGLLKTDMLVMCYSPRPGPRPASPLQRSAELEALRKKILDKSVEAGTISAEVAKRVHDADLAIEPEIAGFQRAVRRVLRLLYEHGELPPTYVEGLKKPLDAGIIEFSEEGALRDETEFAIRRAFAGQNGPQVLAALESKGLIGPSRNRMVPGGFLGPDTRPSEPEKTAAFEALLEDGGEPELGGEEGLEFHPASVKGPIAAWRLEIRRAMRAAIKAGIVEAGALSWVERALGIPLKGALK